MTELPLSMATRFDTQHNEGSSATQCAPKKRRTFENIRPEEVKYGIAAANLSRFHDCPNRCVSNVTITDQHGNVVGHVSSYIDKSRSLKSTDDCRLCLGGVTNSSISTVISQQTTFEGAKLLYRQSVCVTSSSAEIQITQQVSCIYQNLNIYPAISLDKLRIRIPGSNFKSAEEQYSSGDDDSQNSSRSSEESYTDTNDKQPTKTTTESNTRRVADVCKWHDAKSVQSRVIPKIDGIFTCVGASSGGKPPLGPSRLRRGVLSGSRSLGKPILFVR